MNTWERVFKPIKASINIILMETITVSNMSEIINIVVITEKL